MTDVDVQGNPLVPWQPYEKRNAVGQVVATMVVMRQSDILKCPFAIFNPSHYRTDGSCKCDDPIERIRMRKWGYRAKDFKNIPLRNG
jgi:hypothetical protein